MKKKILVIDDEAVIGHVVRMMLEPRGHLVLVTDDGSRGFASAQRQHPDLIVLDLMMPVMDGYGVLEALRDDERTAAIPTVILSAVWTEEIEQRCRDLGAKGYVRKPFEVKDLVGAVDAVLAEA